jgi:hypothetical protein
MPLRRQRAPERTRGPLRGQRAAEGTEGRGGNFMRFELRVICVLQNGSLFQETFHCFTICYFAETFCFACFAKNTVAFLTKCFAKTAVLFAVSLFYKTKIKKFVQKKSCLKA